MESLPKIETKRLLLSALTEKDSKNIVKYASNKKVSDTTQNIPHPYQKKDAIFWINAVHQGFLNKTQFTFAIRLLTDKSFIGAVGLRVDNKHQRGELGYWLAEEFWNKGYTSEAVEPIINFAFNELCLNKIIATHFKTNPASGKVMVKNGMIKEAILKEHIKKEAVFHTLIQYRLTKNEFENRKSSIL